MTENFAVLPAATVILAGCDEMDGAVAAGLTVSVPAELVMLPALLLTTTVKFDPLSDDVVAGVV